MSVTRIFPWMLRVFILVLVLATVFRRHQGVISWLAVIVIFTGSMLLVGLGRIDPVKDSRVDSVVMTGVVFTLAFPIAFQQGREWREGCLLCFQVAKFT